MKRLLLEIFVVMPIYCIQHLLRFLFLSGRFGALLHNWIYYGLLRIFASHFENKRKVDWMFTTLKGGNGVAVEWQKKVYTRHPNCWKKLAKNVFIWRMIVGKIRRWQLEKQGYVVPAHLSISANTPHVGCNLKCSHCYAFAYPSAELPFEIFNRVIDEQEKLGLYNVMVIGGEPFMYKGIWKIFERYPRTTFMVPTNGTFITQEIVEKLCTLGNVYPLFSIEGLKKETDDVRGEGVFEKVIAAIKRCQKAKFVYMVTVVVTKNNFETVTSGTFLEFLVELDCLGINYSTYVPIGEDAHPEWVISVEQSRRLVQLGDSIKKRYPLFPTIGLNGIEVTRCGAAREIFHITATGDVETCPFAKWSAGNIKDSSILVMANSHFFKGVRGLTQSGNPAFVPCRSKDLPILEETLRKLGAQPTTKGIQEVKDESGKYVGTRAS